jgi:hypothetical protein
MTPPTEELTRLLTGAAGDLVERDRVPAPDAPVLWRRGRRATWVARAAATGIALVVALLVVTGGLLVGGLPSTAPAQGGTLTYPQVVSDMFTQVRQVGDEPLFGLVTTLPTASSSSDSLVIERQGSLSSLGTTPAAGNHVVLSADGAAPPIAPDGRRALTDLGNGLGDGSAIGSIDLTDGTVARPIAADPVIESVISSRGVWSPDSQHVLVATADGPAVLDRFVDPVLAPADGDREVRAGGWRDDSTLLGVRPTAGGLDVVTRGLTDARWSTAGRVDPAVVTGPGAPSRVFASPDGSRLLLLWSAGSGSTRSVLVDARTGARVPFTGETASTTVAWDTCDPVWQADQPLTALGGLRRPATGESVMRFSGHREHGCVSLAGNELTGTPAPGAAGAWQETALQAWKAALPFGAVLALVGAVWMVVALRRSRRHGEDFLPMVLRLPF